MKLGGVPVSSPLRDGASLGGIFFSALRLALVLWCASSVVVNDDTILGISMYIFFLVRSRFNWAFISRKQRLSIEWP